MFESDSGVGGSLRVGSRDPIGPDAPDASACANVLRSGFVEERRVVAERLLRVAHWADLHARVTDARPSEAGGGQERPATRSGRLGGSDGTPSVTAFAATELGVLLETTTGSARNLIRDVLDLRHRHPVLWHALLAGQVSEWVARRVVRATADAGLTLAQARWVDERTGEAVCRLPFGRAIALVAARIIEVDPEAADERRRAALQRRRVTLGRSNAYGLRTMTAQSSGVDLARVDGMLDALAQALLDRGDADPYEVRRAKALGLMASPAVACTLLAVTVHPQDTPIEDTQTPPANLPAVELAAAFGRTLLALGPAALDRLRPRSVLYYHLAGEALGDGPAPWPHLGGQTCAVARSERDGPLTVPQLREWLEGEQVVIRPVLDPVTVRPVDAYEVPDRLREAMIMTRPVEVFPWGTLSARSADADHTTPWVSPSRGGPPGQTALANLGPLARGHHNAKTLGGWRLHQPEPGTYYWRTPTGHWSRVDATGTRYLGTDRPACLDATQPATQPPTEPATRRVTPFRSLGEAVLADRLETHALAG
jgi:hypothetical protein